MKKIIKTILLCIATITIFSIIPSISNAATTKVTDEETLNSAISSADYGDTVELQNNITVTKPIVIAKELIIDGNGYTITGSSDWTSTSGNQTMFTAQFSDAKLTLKDINLQNGPKYGVQSYDGATVILDNVSVTGFRYGGVLANGGNVEVRKLHLGYNGTNANNGIEIDKGTAATNNPTLTMNGILTSDSSENVVRIPENGNVKEFTVTNAEGTTNKVVVAGGNIVLTDSADNVISETAIPSDVTANADTQNAIITLVVNRESNKIVVDLGKTITQDLLKSHIKLAENYKIDGFYTDEQYVNEFDFNTPIDADKTIYVKISEIQNNQPENKPENVVTEKDETPKTGVSNFIGIAILVILLSAVIISYMRKKDKIG